MLPHWIRNSLGAKLITSTLVFLAVASVPSLWLTVKREKEVLWDQIEERGRSLSVGSAARCTEWMAAFDYPKLETYVDQLVREHVDVVQVEIFRNDGKRVAYHSLHSDADMTATQLYCSDMELQSDSGEVFHLGRVEIQLSTKRSQEIIASRIHELVLYSGLSMAAIALLLLVLLRRVILKPLRELDAVAQRLGDGHLDQSIKTDSEDEVGRLGKNLDSMRSNLRASYSKLKERNTQLHETLGQLSTALREANKADKVKSDFMATVSHEIRTPMNGVLGMTHLLLDTELSDEQKDHAETIQQCGEALLSIVNDVLDFSKSEAGRLELEETHFEPSKLLEGVVKVVSSQAGARGLQLSSTIESDVPLNVLGDPVRMRQILLNLLNNAVKFTESGSVRVRLSVVDSETDAVELLFEVLDTGIGIEEDMIEQLFSPFVQADSSMTRRYGGTGLGLAISRRLVELMGGEIHAESAPGEGSRFFFNVRLKLPVLVTQVQTPSVPEEVVEEHTTGHILVVEDNPVNQKLIQVLLRKSGHRISLAEDGQQALDMWRQESFDLILMDCQLPVMDGYAATRRIREEEEGRGAHVPIVALTANAMSGARERCLEAGMDGHLTKPYRPEDLRRVLREWVGRTCTQES